MQDEHHPLVKKVPGHLFSFEERIFGVMTLTQLLCDIGAGMGILSGTNSLSLTPRIVVSVLLAAVALILIHGRVQEQTLIQFLSLYIRSLFIAKHTTWQPLETIQKNAASIQTTWITMDSLECGIAGESEHGRKGPTKRYWAVLECEGRNIRFLPESDQIKHFSRFETFLCGLEFRLQFISHVERLDPANYRPLCEQREARSRLIETPRLAALQQANIDHQVSLLENCTVLRHFVVVSASAQEEAARTNDGEKRGIFSYLGRFIFKPQKVEIPREQVIDQLRIRISVLQKILQHVDVRSHLLDDADLLQQFVRCLALGTEPPTFIPQLIEEASESAKLLVEVTPKAEGEEAGRQQHSNKVQRQTYKKRLKGLNAGFIYKSKTPQARFEAGVVRLADLVAPSKIDIAPDIVEINVRGKKLYQRYLHVTGYGHQLLCGWVGDLTSLGLPMIISTIFDPIDSQYMINRLEMQLVRLESRRIADQKAKRIGRAVCSTGSPSQEDTRRCADDS